MFELPLSRRYLFFVGLMLALVPASVTAQGMSGGDLGQVVYIDVRDGHVYEFEEGLKRHVEVVAEEGAPSAWLVWEVITGKNTGSYVAGTFGHTWADFDRPPGEHEQMSFVNDVLPHVEEAEVGFWMFRQDLSRGNPGDSEPSAFIQVYHYKPKFDGAQAVESGFMRVKEAANAAMWSGAEWAVHQLVNGGQHPHYAVVIPGESFADFEEPEPNMYEMLVDQLGEDEANELFSEFSAAMEGEESEMMSLRRDLSYMPDGM